MFFSLAEKIEKTPIHINHIAKRILFSCFFYACSSRLEMMKITNAFGFIESRFTVKNLISR